MKKLSAILNRWPVFYLLLVCSLIIAMQMGLMMAWHFGLDFFADDKELFVYIFSWAWVAWAVTVVVLLLQFMSNKFGDRK
ncbi:hypothetical protein [Ruegeria sp. A3M17]|uniref:hypothetical protein n=1 Tax=Ruegeria sp. A3M17 TaxID=2267229 RepID=UPI001313F076|nr:hypothetical protein [Ruegeria sp. A3M17]